MKTILPFVVSIAFAPTLSACPFEGMTLSSIEDSSDFSSTESQWTSFPEEIFAGLSNVLGSFSASECKDAIIANKITDKKTGLVYTAIYTNDDSCDGGNSYGVIILGTEPRQDRAVASIEDSDVSCLK